MLWLENCPDVVFCKRSPRPPSRGERSSLNQPSMGGLNPRFFRLKGSSLPSGSSTGAKIFLAGVVKRIAVGKANTAATK